jgi:hypothetical protein
MSIQILMQKEGNRLVPCNQTSEDDLANVAAKKPIMVSLSSPRNPKQFALAWALATKVAEACDFLHDKEDGMDWLKIKARHVKMITDPRTGNVAIIPKSIAFASLSQDAFKRVLDRMIYVTVTEIVPGMDEGKLRAEISAMVAG